jgi:hypothetical protein
MLKGGVSHTGVTDEEIISEMVMGIDDSEEGPGMGQEEGIGTGWEEGTEMGQESIDVDKHCELVMAKLYCHQDPTASC